MIVNIIVAIIVITIMTTRHKGAHIMESLVNSDYIDEVKIFYTFYEKMAKGGDFGVQSIENTS